MKMKSMALVMTVIFAVIAGLAAGAVGQDVKLMNPDELKAIMGNPDLVIVDVRSSHDWDSADIKIQDAVREDPATVSDWVGKYPKDKKLVFYCA